MITALEQAGVETRPVVAGNFARNPVMRHLDAQVRAPLKAADEIHEDGFFVGNHHYPVVEALTRVAEVLSAFS